MRSVFETQPEVAHVYLGSKRHMLERIFNDENEPFWRSAKQMEIGVIAPDLFRGYIDAQFARTGRRIEPEVVDARARNDARPSLRDAGALLLRVGGDARGRRRGFEQYESGLEKLLRAEHAHFGLVWEKSARAQRLVLHALAREPGRPLAADYRRRHGLPGPSSVQRALDALRKDELVARDADGRAPDRRAVSRASGCGAGARPSRARASA